MNNNNAFAWAPAFDYETAKEKKISSFILPNKCYDEIDCILKFASSEMNDITNLCLVAKKSMERRVNGNRTQNQNCDQNERRRKKK